MFSSFPSDNLSKVLFFGGLVLIGILIKYSQDSARSLTLEINKYNYKMFELKYEHSMDSLELIELQKKVSLLKRDSIKIVSEGIKISNGFNQIELQNARLLFLKKTFLKRKRNEDMRQMREDINLLISNQSNDDIAGPLIIVLAGFILVMGLILWAKKEEVKDHYESFKILKEMKDIPCQSCGMILKYDYKPHMDLEFCSTCFDGEKFNEPDLTFKQMCEKVKKEMESKKVNNKLIKKHLKKLENLNRWVQALKW